MNFIARGQTVSFNLKQNKWYFRCTYNSRPAFRAFVSATSGSSQKLLGKPVFEPAKDERDKQNNCKSARSQYISQPRKKWYLPHEYHQLEVACSTNALQLSALYKARPFLKFRPEAGVAPTIVRKREIATTDITEGFMILSSSICEGNQNCNTSNMINACHILGVLSRSGAKEFMFL